MSNPREYREEKVMVVDGQRPSRRAFLITSASACGALALWSLQSPKAASAAGGGSKTPGMVTIVEFGANGKKTGKEELARRGAKSCPERIIIIEE